MAGKKNNKPGKKVISLGRQGDAPAQEKTRSGKKAFRYPGRGAPKIYGTPQALAKGCEKYFASISRVEELVNPMTGKPECSSLGQPIEQVVWLTQPSMGALARSLGISDRTLRNYEADGELAPVVEWAKGVCRDWLLEQVTTRQKGSLNGLIFVLENNYGMREQLSVEHSGQTLEEFVAGKKAEF